MKNISIVDDYEVLHFDEYPILFIGKNAANQTMIGSFLYENEGNNTLMFFHSIISKTTLIDFLQQNISYLDVLKKAEAIYKVEKDYNYQIINSKKILFSQIDKTVLPLPSAYCPIVDLPVGFNQKAVAY
jgi:hypothetical protein